MLRVGGALTPAGAQLLDAKETRSLLTPVLTQQQAQELQKTKFIDLCFSREGIGRGED